MSVLQGLRLTLVGPVPPPAGGMANQTRQLAELLRGAGVRVDVVQSNRPYRPHWVGRLPVIRAFFRLLPYLMSLWRAAGSSDLFHVMANSGWSWHLFAAPAIRVAAFRGVPVVVNYRGGEAGDFLARSQRSVRATLARASTLVVPSRFLQALFARHGIDSEVVPNIVDFDRFYPARSARPRGAHLVVARSLEPIYDNATAIRALARVCDRYPEARMSLAGTGPELEALRDLTHELGMRNRVRFTGMLDREAMAALYREADVVLNPSTVDNMPNSVLEALASGVPVVSTNVGGVPYILEHGTTARLVPPRDPEAMAAEIIAVLDNPKLADALVAAGLQQVRGYDWHSVRGILETSYAQALGQGRRA